MSFVGNGSSDSITSSALASLPSRWTFAFWYFNGAVPGALVTDQPFAVGSTTTDGFGFSWDHTTATFRQAVFQRRSSGTYDAAKLTSTLSANTWYHIAGRYDGTNISAWLNGANEVNTSSANPSNPSSTYITVLRGNTTGSPNYDDGAIAEVGLWSTNLSDAEMGALGHGLSPRSIRPGSLIDGLSLVRALGQYRNLTWTLTGTTVYTHPSVIRTRPSIWRPNAAAEAGAALSSAGTAVATLAASSLVSSTISATGAATGTLDAALQIAVDLSSTAAATGTLVPASSVLSDLSSAGAATATLVATDASTTADGALSAAGAAVGTLDTALTIAVDLSTTGASTAILEGSEVSGYTTTSLSAAGTAENSILVPAYIVAAALESAGLSVGTLATPAEAAADYLTWGNEARRRRKLIEDDEEELLSIVSALVPTLAKQTRRRLH